MVSASGYDHTNHSPNERLDMLDQLRDLIRERDELACAISAGYATQCQGELEAMTRRINALLKGWTVIALGIQRLVP